MPNQNMKDKMLPEAGLLGKYFHELFRIWPEQHRRRPDWKKLKKGKSGRTKDKRRPQVYGPSSQPYAIEYVDIASIGGPPEVELPCNASWFAVFASIRQAVLDRWMKRATQIYLASSSSAPPLEGCSDVDSDLEDIGDNCQDIAPVRVPKVVDIGLRSVFEIIKESRASHPVLCTKALFAILDVLQGQQPDGLKGEPPDIIDPLFSLLLDLATSHGPEPDAANDGTHLTAVACACLLSLVVVRGDTGKLLNATGALLMCPRALATQNIQMPLVMTALQRSVHGVLLGKVARPDWLTHGVPHTAKIDDFVVKMSKDLLGGSLVPRSMASDGEFLYLYTSKGLLKIGSGYRNTMKGLIYQHAMDFFPDDKGWLGYANGKLYFKRASKRSLELLTVDQNGLYVTDKISLNHRDIDASVFFSDGECLGMITSAKDDGFVVRTINPMSSPVVSISELPLKLARKCLSVYGSAAYDEDSKNHSLQNAYEEDVAAITAGKDFGLIRTSSGKVLYSGKPASLGIKQPGPRSGKWVELPITKSPKIVHIAVGHDGLHAVLVAEDGSAYFTGTARRGEDGDQSKARRQPKAVKPKKMTKVDGQHIVYAACNNGTTALITKEGELLMFGKDTSHCDPATGHVTDLKDIPIIQVALGKAHAVALSSKGHVYTFGINNKGQCGRDFSHGKEALAQAVVAMETTGSEDGDDDDLDWEDMMCSPGKHKWRQENCMVCTVCRECTGYSISCLSSMRADRNPGQECGCGEGDSGCEECGCCRICARENTDNSELAILGPSGAGDIAGMMRLDLIFRGCHGKRLQDHLAQRLEERKQRQQRKGGAGSSKNPVGRVKAVAAAGTAAAAGAGPSTAGGSGGRGERAAHAHGLVKVPASPFRVSPLGAQVQAQVQAQQGQGSRGAADAAEAGVGAGAGGAGGEGERDASRATSLPPTRLYLPTDKESPVPVVQIACGLHHSAVLTQSGDVFTFGDNLYGQLGVGDPVARSVPGMVRLPFHAVHIACGSYHTVVLTVKGEVITFGNHSKGQLGRVAPLAAPHPQPKKEAGKSAGPSGAPGPSGSSGAGVGMGMGRPDWAWYATPDRMPHIGPRNGRRATWVGASGDQTFLRIDESLINSSNLSQSTVMANKASIILAPSELAAASSSFRCLVINRRDGNCNSFAGPEQVDFANTISCLDPLYSVVWCYQPASHTMVCYNVVSSETRVRDPPILSSELALPVVASCFVTRAQAALHLLCCLDTLTKAHDLNMGISEDSVDKTAQQAKVYSREDFSAVSRFESHGGGWGYSAHSIEAVRFMADTDILLGGLGLFGGRGEYTGKIKLFDIGVEGGEQETDGELLAETEEIPYECGPRQKYPMLFDEPVPLQANRWYVAWARVSGPSSDCGSSGQGMVTTEDQVIFYFKSSKKSNNGTDNNAGQIPQILYRVVTPENHTPNRQVDQAEPVYILSRDFSRAVSKECFESLLALLSWSWNTLKVNLMDISGLAPGSTAQAAAMIDLRRLMYISRSSLRLLCSYINEIYPNQVATKKLIPESVLLAECIGDVRALLRQILSDSMPTVVLLKGTKSRIPASVRALPYSSMITSILEECHQTFVSCFHAFYPTAFLKWTCLCDLLAAFDRRVPDETSSDRLLSAVLNALCSPTIRLRSTFPILSSFLDASDSSLKRQLSPSDNTGLPMMPCVDSHHYPILVEQMSYRSQLESCDSTSTWAYRDVLERLLDMVSVPVRQELCQERVSYSSQLVNNCCNLLARVVAELSCQSSGGDEDLEGTCGRVLHTTPSRFTRTNQSRTWNTGNGSPDAICFSVDRSGVVIAGVTVYGGMGNYEYELELLDDVSSQNSTGNDPSHTQRWNSLELTRGTFGPDDCIGDIAELKFDKPVTIKEGVKYAVRLRNHGGRTSNGDGGLSFVKGPDGATFSFSTCSLSFNGTTQTRGQIPQILYYSNPQDSENQQSSKALLELQARKATLSMVSAIVQRVSDLLSLARERAEDILGTDMLSNAPIITVLMPLCIADISYLAFTDPRSAVQVLGLVQELLPHIAALNLLHSSSIQQSTGSQDAASNVGVGMPSLTTSQHYAWVESEHPYKPATVSNYRVNFPDNIQWMAIEFDPQCGTAQSEDTLQLYIPNVEALSRFPKHKERERKSREADKGHESDKMQASGSAINFGALSPEALKSPYDPDPNLMFFPHWPVFHRFSGSPGNWPQAAIVLPGNQVIFSLETASDYIKDDKACFYGFRCLVIGYEWPPTISDGLRHLEAELAYIGGMCAASLMKKDLMLPALPADEMDEDLELVEEQAHQVYSAHSALLGKGFALASPPTINQALDGVLPFSCHSNERQFLRDLVQCTAGTSGGRLARWLQPDPHVDTGRCSLLYAREDLRQGWPAVLTVVTRDQYGDVVHVPYLKVDAKAVPIDKRDAGDEYTRKIRRVSEHDENTFGGHAHPSLDVPYEITIKDKTYCHAITMMKAYENYSFEELRFISPAVKRCSETMLVRAHGNGTYSVTWTPASVGWYSLAVTIDGYVMDELHKVEVREAPRGLVPPKQSTARKQPHQPSRLRKFVAKKSAGLRIRAHPSLQSEQIGVVPVNGTISFIDEIHNDDGVWLRLNVETIRKFCGGGGGGGGWGHGGGGGGGGQPLDLANDTPPHRAAVQEAWCLQYNQHLGKTLLLPVEEPKAAEQVLKDAIIKRLPDVNSKDGRAKSVCVGYPATYHVVKCGASGHNVRSRPNLKAPPVGMLVLGNTVDIIDHVVTLEGTWVQLDKASMTKYCFNSDGEAWSLAHGRNGAVYLQAEDELFKELCTDPGAQDGVFGTSPKKGFDFVNTSPHQLLAFGMSDSEPSPAAPFKFQSTSPAESPSKTPTPKTFWDDPQPSHVPQNPFVFGTQNSNQPQASNQPNAPAPPPPPPRVAPKPLSEVDRRYSLRAPLSQDAEKGKEAQRDRRQSTDGGKFASLQRWLKGDDGKRPPDRPSAPPKGDMPPELVGISVRELVKAIGESSTNGNGATPPSTPKRVSRSSSPKVGPTVIRASSSSSPVPIPGRAVSGMHQDSQSSGSSTQAAGSAGVSSLGRGSTQSDTSALVSSLTKDPSSTSPGDIQDLSPGPSAGSSCSMRSEGSTKEASVRQTDQDSDSSSKSVSQAVQTSPDGTTAVKGRFSMGTVHTTKDDSRLSPKLGRKGDRSFKGRAVKRAVSPAATPVSSARERMMSQPTKEAISPSVAESLRAVFASFLWHEGIVHDAMACASFLKFHPNLPKQGAVVVTRPQPVTGKQSDKVKQRHSVEVTNAGSYLHIQPATLESLTRSAANANANRSRTKKPQTQAEAIIREELGIPGSVDGIPLQRSSASQSGDAIRTAPGLPSQTVAILPPALKALVILWEQLSSSCLHAINNQTALLSPNPGSSQARSLHRLKPKEKAVSFKDQDANKENKDVKKSGRKKKEWRFVSGTNYGIAVNAAAAPPMENETVCELCGNCYPHPVTYHMRVAHPGCGAHAGGKGYNSGGNFCVGWAGNCGDGGIGGSSWYLVCDACRDRYLRTKKSSAGQGGGQSSGSKKSGIPLRKRSVYSGPGSGLGLGLGMALGAVGGVGVVPAQDAHIVMRNNAMFLLELASAAGSGLHLDRRSSPNMPPLAEHYPYPYNYRYSYSRSPQEAQGPFTPVGPFQCLAALGAHPSQLRDDAHHFPGPGGAGAGWSLAHPNQGADEESNGNGHGHRGGGARPVSEFYSEYDADGRRGGGGFHRSASMGTSTNGMGTSWSRREAQGAQGDASGRVVMMRRRNNSSSELTGDGGSYLLCYPSAALQKLVPNMDRSAIVSSSSASPGGDILSRPVMAFLFQQHNLESLQFAMKQALRKATCRVFAMQALNWLLHNVTQPGSLHDLLWWLVAALTSSCQDSEQEIELSRGDRKDDLDMRAICEHPLSDISIAGEAVHPLPSTFHSLLQSVADLMLLLPLGSALQQMAVQCWGLRFTPQDHMFLHRSQVFSNISKILSHSEEEQDDMSLSMHESHLSNYSQVASCVENLKDLTPEVDIKASSRQAMVVSLTDNSTETFWESGDEDRNKTKIITITCESRSSPRMVYIHIDNCRDLANKVSSVILLSGQAVDELYFIQQTEVENRSTGWIRCPILESNHTVIRLELKGPDNSLRVRQIRILGDVEGESTKTSRQHSAITIQQRNCEAETLRVFRLITGQVFGKLLQQQQQSADPDSQQAHNSEAEQNSMREAEENNDLKEHMVGILFSRSKLTHLQKQVVIHIVQAIRKEALHVREEWEVLLCSPPNAPTAGLTASFGNGDMMKQADAYCFEMLSMVLALSGSSVGKAYLAQQHGLLRDVLSLLHTGSARVQRQVTSLLRRMLPEVAPHTLGSIMNIEHLPQADFSIVTVVSKAMSQTDSSFDIHKVNILDVFLSCIAKALTVQVKVKGKEAGTTGGKGLTTVTLATSIHPRDFVGARWWLRGCITRKLAEVIIQLLKDMAAGKLSDSWAEVTKGAIAESILNLTRLGETERTPNECLRTPTLWLALAALCVLDSDHVERLSSGEWRGTDGQPPPPRPTCSNHDDGETGAIIQCSVCGNLCAECDRFLHLHRRTRMHQRQVCKEEEEAIKVDLHEGCGRTKLFWVMALADSSTLKAMVEFRERRSGKSANFSSGTCRFCGTQSNTGLLAISNVCADQECQEHAKNACTKHHPCGHVCGGIAGETSCLPCLHRCSGNPSLKQDADDMCMICFTEALSCAPAIQLSCGHVFHLHCCQNVLQKRWPGPRITFGFSQCPICKAAIEHEVLNELLVPVKELLEDVRRKALMRLEYEGLHQAEAITTPGARFYNDPAAYAMDRYAYYVCFKCNKAYYGGEARCDAEMGEQYDPTELVCGGCSDVASAQMCPKHGTDFLEYKCRYCCSVAVFFCFGSTHFCNPCHDDFQRVTNIPKNELPSCPAGPKAKQLEGDECPLHVKHPPTGEEFALGCGVCRNAHTF